MQGNPPPALGSGAYVAGVAAAVALLVGVAPGTVAAVAVAGLCVGIVAGGLVVTRTGLLAHSETARVTGLPLVGLVVWVTWTGIQRGAASRYQLTIGGVFLAVVGWAVLVRGGATGVGGSSERTATLATLPQTGAEDGRRRQFSLLGDVGALVVVAYFFYRAVVLVDPSSWLFGGLFLAVFLPGTRSQVRLTEAGLRTTRHVLWVVPLDRSHTPWTALYGYEVSEERLRIGTNYGDDLTYDRDRLDDGVVTILDEHLPRL